MPAPLSVQDPDVRGAMRALYIEAGVVRTRVLKGKEQVGVTRVSQKRIGRLPNVGYLSLILKIQERRAKLLGLDKAVTFEQALEADPSLASAWAPYLQLLFLMGDRDRLELAVARAQQAIPEEPEVIGFRGILLAQGGAFQEAAPLLQAALEKRPTMPFLNYSLGLAMHKLHQDEQAEPFLLEEARLFPSSLPVKKVLVEIYASQRRYAEQIDQLLPIIQAEPPNHLTFHSLAQAQYNDKRYPEALETVQECRALAPGYPACAMLLANVLKKLGRDDEAQAAYRQALEIGEQVTGMTLTGSETSPSPDTP